MLSAGDQEIGGGKWRVADLKRICQDYFGRTETFMWRGQSCHVVEVSCKANMSPSLLSHNHRGWNVRRGFYVAKIELF